MTLGDDIAAALPLLRAEAESRMRDTCTITRPGAVVLNHTTHQNEASTVTVYSGKCRVRAAVMRDRVEEAVDQTFIQSQYIVSLPVVGSEGVLKGDTVTIVTSASDPALPGTSYTVVGPPAQSDATARRFPVRELQ